MMNDDEARAGYGRGLDAAMAECLDAMAAEPMTDKVRTLIGAVIRASGLAPEQAWCALAATVSLAHGDAPAAVTLILPAEQAGIVVGPGEPARGVRGRITFHANGGVEREAVPHVASFPADDGGPRH